MLAKLPIFLSERESLYQLGVNVTRSSPGREGDFSSLFILECDGDKVPLCSPGQQMYLWPRAALSVALRLFALQTSLDKALTALDLEDTEKPEFSLKTKMRRCDVRCLKGIRGVGLTSELIHEGRANYRHDSARVFREGKDDMRWVMYLACPGTSGRAGWPERHGQAGGWCGEFSQVIQDPVGSGFSLELIWRLIGSLCPPISDLLYFQIIALNRAVGKIINLARLK